MSFFRLMLATLPNCLTLRFCSLRWKSTAWHLAQFRWHGTSIRSLLHAQSTFPARSEGKEAKRTRWGKERVMLPMSRRRANARGSALAAIGQLSAVTRTLPASPCPMSHSSLPTSQPSICALVPRTSAIPQNLRSATPFRRPRPCSSLKRAATTILVIHLFQQHMCIFATLAWRRIHIVKCFPARRKNSNMFGKNCRAS